MTQFRVLLAGLCLLAVGVVSAQPTTCPALVQEALNTADEACATPGRNQACYGNVQLEADPVSADTPLTFDSVGDIAPLNAIQRLRLSPLDEEAGQWGIAVMKVQANLPDTLPGQNITLLAFGDVVLENRASADAPPMQAFTLRTGVGPRRCDEAPPDGLLVQTPEGSTEVSFNVNGVDVQVGSTVLFEAQPDAAMQITTLEGSAVTNIGGELFPAIAGTRVRVPLNERLRPVGFPSLPESYDNAALQRLPLNLLERDIEIAPALDGDALERLRQQLQFGDPPCDEEGLIDCDDLPGFREIEWDIRSNNWEADFIPGLTCAVSEEVARPTLPVCPSAFLDDFCEDNPRRFFCQEGFRDDDEESVSPEDLIEQDDDSETEQPDDEVDDETENETDDEAEDETDDSGSSDSSDDSGSSDSDSDSSDEGDGDSSEEEED